MNLDEESCILPFRSYYKKKGILVWDCISHILFVFETKDFNKKKEKRKILRKGKREEMNGNKGREWRKKGKNDENKIDIWERNFYKDVFVFKNHPLPNPSHPIIPFPSHPIYIPNPVCFPFPTHPIL